MQGGKLPAQVPRHEGKPSDWTDTTKAMKFGTVMGGGGGGAPTLSLTLTLTLPLTLILTLSLTLALARWAGCPCTNIARSRFESMGACYLQQEG